MKREEINKYCSGLFLMHLFDKNKSQLHCIYFLNFFFFFWKVYGPHCDFMSGATNTSEMTPGFNEEATFEKSQTILAKWACVHAQLPSHVWLFCNPWTVPHQALLSMISQARILEWVVISSSRGPSQPRDWTHVSCTGRRILYHWATREARDTSRSQISLPHHCCFSV